MIHKTYRDQTITLLAVLGAMLSGVGCESDEGESNALASGSTTSSEGPGLSPDPSGVGPSGSNTAPNPGGSNTAPNTVSPNQPPPPSGGAGGEQPSGDGGSPVISIGGSSGSATPGSGGDGPTAQGGNGAGMSSGGSAGDVNLGGSNAGGNGTGGDGTAGGAGEQGAAGNGGDPIASGESFDVSVQLASDVEPDAPGTIGIVTWSVEDVSVESAYVEFGPDTDYGTQAPVDLEEEDYRTLLLGMKPGSTYHFRVVASDGSTSYASDDYTVETGPPTNAVSMGDFTVVDEVNREPGFLILSYWQGSGSSVVFILDQDGEVVWWYDTGMNGVARARMSADGKNLWMITPSNQGGALRRVSMDTLEGQTYNQAIGSHDLTPVSGDLMAFLEYGENDCDSIFEIDPSGNTEEVFESDDFVMGGGCHSNALRYSQTEDVYTFSDVSTDIFIVNRTGGVEWKLTDVVSGGVSAWGGRNHGHHLLDDSIVIYANDGGQSSSAAIEYTLDGEEIWRFDSGEGTANLGDVQRLPGGNTIVTHSNDSILYEVDPDSNVVLEFDGAGAYIGYTMWRESLYGPPPDILQ